MELATTDVTAPTRPRRHRRWPWSFVLAGVAIAAAIVYLVLANTRASAEYYMTIGELRACRTCQSQTVRVAANVVPGTIVKLDGGQTIHFTIADAGGRMPVTYGGVVPDIFKAGIQVVVEGRMQPDGVFHAQTLLAKCPSRFQSTPSGQPAGGGSGTNGN